MNFPKIFDIEEYLHWHQRELEEGVNVLDFISNLQKETTEYFFHNDGKLFNDLFGFINESIRISTIRRTSIDFGFAPEKPKNKFEFSQRYLKTTHSIINKLWRKNKENKNIKTENIKSEIKDLVRFSIKVDSLKSAEVIARVLSDKSLLCGNSDKCKSFFQDTIEKIDIDNEMKMSSGYFAYHCYFHFNNSIIVEVQIFSELSNYWRKMSHSLYEKVRINSNESMQFNDIDSRIISIGHMLYLAECELYNIEEILKK